jgi:hypothetical protein
LLGIRLGEGSLFLEESTFRDGDFMAVWIGEASRVSRGLIRRDLPEANFLGISRKEGFLACVAFKSPTRALALSRWRGGRRCVVVCRTE